MLGYILYCYIGLYRAVSCVLSHHWVLDLWSHTVTVLESVVFKNIYPIH